MAQLFVNNGATTLSATLANGATSATITSGTIFPAVASPDFMYVTLDDGTNVEIVKITAHTASSTTITIARGQDGSTQYAGTWGIGTKVECRLTAGSVMPGAVVRETFSNANVTIAGSADRLVSQIGTMSAARTVTLPSASLRAGQTLTIIDESGSVTQTNKLTITRAGTDTIVPAGSSITSFDMVTPGRVTLVSDGTSKWVVIKMTTQRWLITSTGSWIAPPGVYAPLVTIVGGGGGGGSTTASATRSAGGGGAGAINKTILPITPGTSYTLTIGAGGASNTAGGSTTFGSLLTAVGGKQGDTNTGANYGASYAGAGGTGGDWFTSAQMGTILSLATGAWSIVVGAATAVLPGNGGASGNSPTPFTQAVLRPLNSLDGTAPAYGGADGYGGGAGGIGYTGVSGAGGNNGGTGAAGGAPGTANSGAGGGGAGGGTSAQSGGTGSAGRIEIVYTI